jgi:myo-inositol-1(or 4)-monophosphatase
MAANPDRWSLANAVGELVRKSLREAVFSTHCHVEAKVADVAGDVVTDTDHAAQTALEDGLTKLVPGSAFIGEEGFKQREALSDQPHWIVDPLDGTLNFASDLPFFGASVALIEGGSPVLGVVYDFGADVCFDALAGFGARQDSLPFRWDALRASRAPVGVSSGFLAQTSQSALPGKITLETPWLGSRYRIFGSQAIQLCWAAAGRLKLNINYEAKLWDDAAGALICNEAGASYCALHDDPLFPLGRASPALAGRGLFSVSGSPDMVALFRQAFQKG